MKIKTFAGKEVTIGEGYLYNLLNEVLNNERYAEYLGGTLCLKIDNHLLSFNIGECQTQDLNRMVAKLYLKYKTPKHAFYKQAQRTLVCNFKG